jgi:hypothetical protein
MTPGERGLMTAEIAAAVEAAVRPLNEKIQRLEQVDRRHSGVHRELGTSLRSSQSDIAAQVDNTVDALARRDQQLVAALNELREEVRSSGTVTRASIAPAALAATAAKAEATDAATEARNAAIDIKLVKTSTASASMRINVAVLLGIVQTMVTIAYHILTTKGP